jgi:hypothetical protein
MNRYQKEVAEIDARQAWRVKVVSSLGAATLIVVALWAADFKVGSFDFARTWQDARDWWEEDWFPERDERYAVPPQLPTPVDEMAKPGESVKPLPGTDSSVSKVPLPLILVRTEPGRNAREGKAFMGTAKENPQTYMAGAILANGAQIKEVHQDHVLLERDGKSVKLFIDGSKQNRKALTDLLTVGGQPEPKLAVATTREVLTDYIRPSPVFDGDVIKGYQVYAGQRVGVFSQLGLQNGDLIIAINDMPFIDPRQSMDMFKQLTDGMAVVATVERNGKRERISLNGSLISEDLERQKNPPPAAPPEMMAGPPR